MNHYNGKVSEGIASTVDDDDDDRIGCRHDEAEYRHEESPQPMDDDSMDQERDTPPVVPPPLIEDLQPPPPRQPSYDERIHRPIYPRDADDEPTTPTSGGCPSLPTTPPPGNSINRMSPSGKYHETSPLPQTAEPQSTLSRNNSPMTRDHSTLPREHVTPSRDHDMDDKLSAKNTITSYRTDRTARTIDPEARAKARKIYRSALTHLVCGLYALILVVTGLAFSLSTSLTRKIGEGSLYLQVFLLYIYGISLFFLAYLQCCLLGRRKSRDDSSFNHVNLVSNNHLENDKCSMDYNHDLDMIGSMSKDKRSRSRSHSDFEEAMDGLQSEFDAITFDAEDINFYLRLGAIIFGLGSMIHDGFRIASLFVDGTFSLECRGPLYVAVALTHMVFTFFQTFYLFKNHKIVINKHKAFVRFGFMHMVAANLCVWCMTTVTETAESLARRTDHRILLIDDSEQMNGSGELPTGSMAPLEPPDCYKIYHRSMAAVAAPYLFPCTIQYSLIATAILYRMYCNVGSVAKHTITTSVTSEMLRISCHKANKGLFLGLFVGVLTLIAVSCFFVFTGKLYNYDIGQILFFGTELVLLVLSSSVVIVGFARLQKLRFVLEASEGQLDVTLLVISFFGICMFDVFLTISSLSHLLPFDVIALMTLATAAVGMLQTALQTVFIMDGLRRCAESQYQVDSKPGRELITFLLLCNLSLWVVNTFEVKKSQSVHMHELYFGQLAWQIITHICIPLLIFFRFHSTVCLSDIWVNAYKLKKKAL